MNNNNSSNGTGIGFCGLLTIAFIVLKLTNIIKWSWLWVLSPCWIPLVLLVIVVVFIIVLKVLRKNHKRGRK